ncbi:hypothetical protein MKW92_001204, partial [Papaver armeniacum]
MEGKYSAEMFNEVLIEAYGSMSHELHRLQSRLFVEEEMLMHEFYEKVIERLQGRHLMQSVTELFKTASWLKSRTLWSLVFNRFLLFAQLLGSNFLHCRSTWFSNPEMEGKHSCKKWKL